MAEWGFYPAGGFEARTSAGSRKPSKHVGRTTRMGIEQYQDYTLYINDDRDVRTGRKLTDEQLCADWQWEFPDAVTFIPFHVKGVRRDFVAGKCAKAKADRRTVSAALTAGWWAARTARNTEGPARHRQASMARNDKRHPSET